MTINELVKLYNQQVEFGLESCPLILKMKRKSKRRINSNRVRTPFGMCRWHRIAEDELAIYVTFEQVRKFIISKYKEVK